MSISIDGTTLTFTGTVTVTNFTDPTTGVCTLTLTPSGGVGSLPALAQGDPGLPALFTLGTVTTLSAGQSATVTLTQTDPGGAGENSEYTIAFGIPQGADGTDGTTGTLAGSSDITGGSAAVGDMIMVSSVSPTRFTYFPIPYPSVINPASISSISTSGNVTGTLCTVSVAAQLFNWIPICFAQCTTVGTTNTAFTMQAKMSAGGEVNDIVGKTTGLPSVATQRLTMLPAFGGLLTHTGGYGVVLAGDTATITLSVTETASTSDAWTVSNTTASFTIVMLQVLG